LAVRVPVDWEPLTALAPDQAPEALHEVALVDDHTRTRLAAGDRARADTQLTVGAGALTETVADCARSRLFPCREGKGRVGRERPVDWVPRRALVPDQAPEAMQAVALVDDHVRMALAPLLMALGPTLKLTVGSGALTETVVTASHCPWGRYRSACRSYYL